MEIETIMKMSGRLSIISDGVCQLTSGFTKGEDCQSLIIDIYDAIRFLHNELYNEFINRRNEET